MVCTHLRELYQLCESNQLRISSSDLVRITCTQCEETETCPSVLLDEYEERNRSSDLSDAGDPDAGGTSPRES